MRDALEDILISIVFHKSPTVFSELDSFLCTWRIVIAFCLLIFLRYASLKSAIVCCHLRCSESLVLIADSVLTFTSKKLKMETDLSRCAILNRSLSAKKWPNVAQNHRKLWFIWREISDFFVRNRFCSFTSDDTRTSNIPTQFIN